MAIPKEKVNALDVFLQMVRNTSKLSAIVVDEANLGLPGLMGGNLLVPTVPLGLGLPVKRQHSDGNTYIVQPKTIAEAQALGIDLAEQTKSCNAIYQQFQGLMPQNVVPKIRMGKVRSLLTQGFTGWTTGLSHRPQHPYQCEVFDSLQQYFPTMTGWLGGLPTVHFSGIFEMQQDEENFFSIPWEKSIMKTRSTFVFVRRSRKETWYDGRNSNWTWVSRSYERLPAVHGEYVSLPLVFHICEPPKTGGFFCQRSSSAWVYLWTWG